MNTLNRDSNIVASDNNNEFLGLEKDKAIALCLSQGFTYRVVYEDGEYFIVTMDLRMDRVNFSIENNIVISSHIG